MYHKYDFSLIFFTTYLRRCAATKHVAVRAHTRLERMRILLHVTAAVLALSLAGASQAAVKLYDSSVDNGTPGDSRTIVIDICPPVTTNPPVQGYKRISDDGLGTVTLDELVTVADGDIAFVEGELIPLFGPGAFVFFTEMNTSSITAPHVSNTSGIGAHGPSGTAPGESAEWGIVSGWTSTGVQFCISSPLELCAEGGVLHGATIPASLASNTYNLGTWNFDAVGDMSADWYLVETNNGGLANTQSLLRGSFVGLSLPALPLIGFGALALALATIGGRALVGRR